MSKKNLSNILIMVSVMLFIHAWAIADDRFTDNGDGTVTDHQLGLMWAKTDNQGDINWNQAKLWVRYTFPDTIQTAYDDWRLPTLSELQSLYVSDNKYKGYETDCGQRVKIVPDIKLSCGWVWTSETSAIQAYIFNFNRGYHYSDRMVHNKAYRALPVRNLK
ncbi:MAG: DUF1566 domain-containing protein [Thermodesulfobacteriota bacterium]|nr:DUF1566 domain-containing protein [Thermodesulfobacteriota bacterium]